MKTPEFNTKIRKIFFGIVALMMMLPFSLQAQRIHFKQSSLVPAAEGYVKIRTDRNNNNIIKIRIKNLVEIQRLDPEKQTYVVWMVTDRETTDNIGRINSSNNLTVRFRAVSSFQPIKIFITAEVNESTQVPGDKIVLLTDNFWE